MSANKNTKSATREDRIDAVLDALLTSDGAIVDNLRDLNAKIANITASPKTSPLTAFSMSLDPVYGIDLHFSASIVEETLREMAPTVLPALEAMRDAMVRKHAPQPVAAKQPKKQPAASGKKNAKAKKAR